MGGVGVVLELRSASELGDLRQLGKEGLAYFPWLWFEGGQGRAGHPPGILRISDSAKDIK